MFFAQLPTPIEVRSDTPVGMWLMLITGIIAAIGFQVNSWRKNKREQEDRLIENQTSIEIRDVLRQVEIAGNTQIGKLETVVEIEKIHHEELIRTLQTNCKAQPVQVTQVNKEK
jgi:triphosphoribosyl-dephospho-CoA synthetase